MGRATKFIALLAGGMVLMLGMFLHSAMRQRKDAKLFAEKAALVERLVLTDLCLATDAGYARRPATTDRFGVFQDHPLALEHYPSGSLLAPPSALSSQALAAEASR